ncbi:NFACT RNA binding domain-containing protein [Desulfovibrio sp. OttesenSCG-928-G11]|nr:NFACT RNA binding domain-containing protein [Desulfovibrio sp. OttesenSCG-928-G11]
MDAHFFRILAQELCLLLEGARLEKIHSPLPDVFSFLFFAGGRKLRLLLRFGRQAPALFFSREKMSNPARAQASVMRLRKYCANRRLGPGRVDFAGRRLLFALPGPETAFLLLDMTEGPSLLCDALPGFDAPPLWPDRDTLDALCQTSWDRGERKGPWRQYPVLTPFLRETLAALPREEGRALLVDLEAGGGEVFLYAAHDGKGFLPSAWPLPAELTARRGLDSRPLPLEEAGRGEAVFLPWLAMASEAAQLLPDYPALAAACLAWEGSFFAGLAAASRQAEAQPLRKEAKKQKKLLARLAAEEERLTAMQAQHQDALALQGHIWRYEAGERRAMVTLPEAGGERPLALDPRLTVRENMARMFKESARGARGLAMLRERRQALMAGSGAEGALILAADGKALSESALCRMEPAGARPAPERAGARPAPLGPGKDVAGVARFLSSDGFVLLRGKNAAGNQRLLKIGSGHDLWLHAASGPSAHLIIRRAHGAEEVPERSLGEAAALVAARSSHREDAAVDVMVALLRHVHQVRGAAPGTVRVDEVMRGLRVEPARE